MKYPLKTSLVNINAKHNNSDGLYDYMKREIERLKKQSNNYAKRIINALDYINKHAYSNISKSYDELYNGQIEELVNILEGADKE